MTESKERLKDSALLEQFEIAPHLRISTGLAIVIQRQLAALSKQSGVPIERMGREFLVEQLCKVNVSDAERVSAKNAFRKALENEKLKS
ncbi:MAG: hypothetical protein ACI9FR_001019 [Cryomorphaceae bacterium]|jgi:hypothetical protein